MSHLRRHRCHRLSAPRRHMRVRRAEPRGTPRPHHPGERVRRRGHPREPEGHAPAPMPCPISACSAANCCACAKSPGARPAGAPRPGSHLRRLRGPPGALVTDASAIRGFRGRRRGRRLRPRRPSRARAATRTRRVHRLCEKRVPAHLLLVVDEVRDVHVRRAPPVRPGPRAGRRRRRRRAAQRRGHALDVESRDPAESRAHRRRGTRRAVQVARHRRHRRRVREERLQGFAAAPGKPRGRPRATVPGTASPKFSVSRFAAFAPSPPSSPASFFPRARLRLAGPDGSSPPASAARLARPNSASATSCSFSLATFALGLGFGFGRTPFLPSEAFGSGRFKTARKRRAGGTRVTRRGRRRSERRDAAQRKKKRKNANVGVFRRTHEILDG